MNRLQPTSNKLEIIKRYRNMAFILKIHDSIDKV